MGIASNRFLQLTQRVVIITEDGLAGKDIILVVRGGHGRGEHQYGCIKNASDRFLSMQSWLSVFYFHP